MQAAPFFSNGAQCFAVICIFLQSNSAYVGFSWHRLTRGRTCYRVGSPFVRCAAKAHPT